MNKRNMDSAKNKSESQDIYQTLCNSESMYQKLVKLEYGSINMCLHNTLEVLLKNEFSLIAGSAAEGTHITSGDYVKHMHAMTQCYISDMDVMHVMCYMRVIDEGDMLPQRFDNYIYCQAERGEHTTDGFRKLRVIHRPQYYLLRQHRAKQWMHIINTSLDHGYMSSSKMLSAPQAGATEYSPFNEKTTPVKSVFATTGPSYVMEQDGFAHDFVRCFHVKTWPKEAESWFTRQTHWPDRKLKSQIMKTGYLLVPTGNSNSQESDLEWRCSFSVAEKILFQSMTKFQRCTFVMLKVLLKVYLPSDINTDGEKQLLSTYHIKTLFLWSLKDSKLVWEPERMLDIIGHLLDKLSGWINHQYVPHYFIPSVTILDSRRLHGRDKLLICFISAIRNDLSNKIKQSQFYKSQKSNQFLGYTFVLACIGRCLFSINIHHHVIQSITDAVQDTMHSEVFINMYISRELNISHSELIDGLISIKHDIDPQVQHLYRAVYSDPVHDKLLTEVVPGLIDQYRGSIHLAKYCMAARDGRELPGMLHTAESLLKNALHLEPCSGYVKLACLYMTTGDFVQAMDRLHVAENKFLLHKNVVMLPALNCVKVDKLSSELYTVCIHEVFQKWAAGQRTSPIVVTWPEYITVPDLLQFELIHESTQQVVGVPHKPCNRVQFTNNMVALDCNLKWPPLSMIKLLKFVCTFTSGQSSTSHLKNLVAELIASSRFVRVFPGVNIVNDIYTVFNMAAWCYVKIKKYKPAAHMMMVAIGTSPETQIMNRCAFSHHFVAYVIAHCII